MKKRILSLLAIACAFATSADAQRKIQVTQFERNVTSLIASMESMQDYSGEACAVVQFFVSDDDFEIEGNLGVLRQERRTGEIRLWMPVGTKRLTIRHQGIIPLTGYVIPIRLESKVTYRATVEIREKSAVGSSVRFYGLAGYNVMGVSGPSVGVGINMNHHVVEVGGIYGLNKTDDIYFYNSSGDLAAANNYQAFRIGARYGYELELADWLTLTPQVGAAYNVISGSSASAKSSGSLYRNAGSVSALAAVRLGVALSDHFWLQVTPEYDFGATKDDVCKLVSDMDDTFKSWTEGFCVNVGLIIRF